MRLVAHELVKRDSRLLAVFLNHDVRNLSHMAHFGRPMKASVVLGPAEFKDGLYVLLLSDNQVIALQVKRRLHAYSRGTTLTTPAAVS